MIPVTESQLAILTPQGHRVVGSMSGGGIPPGLAVAFVDLRAEWGDTQRANLTRYSVTHCLSGRGIGPGFESIHDARHLAEALHDVADWTLPAFALCAIPGIESQVREILDRAITQREENYP